MVNRIRAAINENKDQGFTLIELLVVIIIIGILAAIAIPVFLNQRKKGVDAGIKADLKNAATVIETWNTDNPGVAVGTAIAKGTGGPATVTATAGGPTNPLTDFKASPGNVVKVTPGTATGAYSICAFNAGASVATDGTAGKSLYYDSNDGGLHATPLPGACN